jgi:hypothetical protein
MGLCQAAALPAAFRLLREIAFWSCLTPVTSLVEVPTDPRMLQSCHGSTSLVGGTTREASGFLLADRLLRQPSTRRAMIELMYFNPAVTSSKTGPKPYQILQYLCGTRTH